jgi:hypothetical protein
MAEAEAALSALFRRPVRKPANYRMLRAAAMVTWIDFAYRMGDDTYLDFTGGKRLHPRTIAFPPEAGSTQRA